MANKQTTPAFNGGAFKQETSNLVGSGKHNKKVMKPSKKKSK